MAKSNVTLQVGSVLKFTGKNLGWPLTTGKKYELAEVHGHNLSIMDDDGLPFDFDVQDVGSVFKFKAKWQDFTSMFDDLKEGDILLCIKEEDSFEVGLHYQVVEVDELGFWVVDTANPEGKILCGGTFQQAGMFFTRVSTETKLAPHAGTPIEVLQKFVYLGKETGLTTGKMYQVAEVKRDKFAVVNDKGLNVWFSGTTVEDAAGFFEVCKPVSEVQLRKDDLVLCVSATHCDLLVQDNVYKVVRVDDHSYDVQEPTTGAVIANLPRSTFNNFFLALNINNKKELITLITSRPESSTTKAAKRVQRPVGSIADAKVGDYVKYLGGEEAIYGTTIKENSFYKVVNTTDKFVFINTGGNAANIRLNRNASQWQLVPRKEMELILQKAVLQQIDDNLKIAYRLSDDGEECLSDDEVEKTTLFVWWHKDKGIRVSEACPGNSLVNKKAMPIFGEMIPMMLEGVEMGHLVEMHYNGKVMELEVYNCDEDHDMDEDCGDCENDDWDEDEVPCSGCEKCGG